MEEPVSKLSPQNPNPNGKANGRWRNATPVSCCSLTIPHPYKTFKKTENWPLISGTLVLIDGSVLHKSERNQSSISRFIYTFHMVSDVYDDFAYMYLS
jgi:ectoine hydroxylase-related dioxygenase (phytanoyl-CoA dioxygenase family)